MRNKKGRRRCAWGPGKPTNALTTVLKKTADGSEGERIPPTVRKPLGLNQNFDRPVAWVQQIAVAGKEADKAFLVEFSVALD